MKNEIPFMPLLNQLEGVIGHTTDPFVLITLLSKSEFLELRKKIVEVFDIGPFNNFTGKFGSEVEFGDVSDAIRLVTYELYPKGTPLDKHQLL